MTEAIERGRKLLLEIGGDSWECWAQNDKTYEKAGELADTLAGLVGYPVRDEDGKCGYPESTPPAESPSEAYERGVRDAESRATRAFTALGRWEQRTNAGSVCCPQPMHDGTLRIYAGVPWNAPAVAQGADVTAVALSLCKTLGLDVAPPKPPEPR